MAPVIDAKDLFKCYPGFPPVLRGVNIKVESGEMVAIMGPSGCGKSTMLHILGMLHAPDSGDLTILGQNVLKFNSQETAAFRRGNMGFVMQASNLFEHSTVFENVEFPLIYENIPPQERWERVIRALDLVRLSSRVHYRSNRLSGGEQQRVAIARAMVNNPRILLADEPTGALDARTSVVIMENFRSLCHNGGVAMVMVTHDPKMAEYCDSVYTLEEGALRCKKHDPPHVKATSSESFLKPPEPIVRGSLVGWKFPEQKNQSLLELARRMHGQGLLSRIYALSRNGIFAGQAGYSLPLGVRRISAWQRILGLRVLWRRARGSVSMWHLWQKLPAHPGIPRLLARMRAFSCGAIVARWCLADNIQFLYAAGARKVAAAVWVAAKLARLPFAFAVRPEEMPKLGKDCHSRAQEAAFITCQTQALADAFLKFAPEVPAEKIIVLPNPPRFASTEEDVEPGLPPAPDKPVDLLCMGADTNPSAFRQTIAALRKLGKKGYRLTLLGKPSWRLRWRLFFGGMRNSVLFAGDEAEDSIAEKFRSADIFIAWAPVRPGLDLAMPWPLCEAMSFGLPIVALSISEGMRPLKSETNCLLAQDANVLADSVRKLQADKTLAGNLGMAAKKDIRGSLNLAGSTKLLTDRIVEAAALAERKVENES